MKHTTVDNFIAAAMKRQTARSFEQSLFAAATLFIKENYEANGASSGFHEAHTYVASKIVERFGPTEAARACMTATLTALDQTALNATYTAWHAHKDIWDVMVEHLDGGTDFPWVPDSHKLAAFDRMMKEAGQAGTA